MPDYCEVDWRPIVLFKGKPSDSKSGAKQWPKQTFDKVSNDLRIELERDGIDSAVVETYHFRDAQSPSIHTIHRCKSGSTSAKCLFASGVANTKTGYRTSRRSK